ncbi:MAG TPA: GNAT family N-acetyltransferase [Gaiellaceae bacterium]|nr:GNAT family N-acetyltransferase [Gaiellaceae bacterium]
MEIPEHVRRQALHPFTELALPAGWKRFEGEHVVVCIHTYPIAQVVEPRDLDPVDVDAAVAEARALVREAGKDRLVWWVEPSYEWLGPELERRGLVNEERPGFEAVENAMALVEPPSGAPSGDVAVKVVETIDELAASDRVVVEAFGMGSEAGEEMEQNRSERYAEYTTPGNPGRQFIGSIDGRVVGTATAAIGDAGVNLFAAGVLPDSRGRGVYRALIRARWDLAVERGTPALTVQAGQMSRPVLESAGFTFIDAARMYADDLLR